jgi:hypothetical protein
MLRSNRTVGIAIIAVLVSVAGLYFTLAKSAAPAADQASKAEGGLVEFAPDGKLKQPVGYRQWVFIGTPLTPNDLNDGHSNFPEFHNVYIDPESFAYWQKTGKFRDGMVIVKDLTSVGSKKAPSGNGYFEGDYTGLEAVIKDSKRFKDEPGNVAYFDWGHKPPLEQEVAKKPTAECNTCHQNFAKTDWVFTQYYPVLRASAPHSK